MTSWEFTASGPITTDINLPAGTVNLTATPTGTVTVSLTPVGKSGERLLEETEVSFDDGTLAIRTRKHLQIHGNAALEAEIGLPEGSSVKVNTASADVNLTGELAALQGKTASGDVSAAQITGDAEVSSASGDVLLQDTGGDVRVNTASGDVLIGRAGGDVIAKTASGDVKIRQAGQSATVKTASGDVRVESITGGLADATTVSGDVVVAVEPGVGVYLDLSSLTGSVNSELDSGTGAGDEDEDEASLTVSCRSVSGDIRIARASAR